MMIAKRFLMGFLFLSVLLLYSFLAVAQYKSSLPKQVWIDSVFNSLNPDERIAQLMVIRAHSNLGEDHIRMVTDLIEKYDVGALCFFQGGPLRQAGLTNFYQQITKTPLMITMDAEWGLGMRLDSVTRYPYQLTLGAMHDEVLMYKMGLAVGEQCRRLGVHVNYAPVADINNNPDNPVIGYRSFGANREQVTKLGVAYMTGMQDAGIMACAKHFPGHGDVAVDSHLDLPVINKGVNELDSMELAPFKAMIDAGVGSIMIAHLSIPSIDPDKNRPTSLSRNTITGLLRDKLGFKGLTFTDALEMKGVTKYYPGGKAALEALKAGNDMLCLPESVPGTILAVKEAIIRGELTWEDLDRKVRKVLAAKYDLGLYRRLPVDTANLLKDLNAKTDLICREVAQKTITLVRNGEKAWPLGKKQRVAYVSIGEIRLNDFGQRLKKDFRAATFHYSYHASDAEARSLVQQIRRGKYDVVVISVSNFSLRPGNNYGISRNAIDLWKQLQGFRNITVIFGNVLATGNFCEARNLVVAYQDDDITQEITADMISGSQLPLGTLPVPVCDLPFGSGLTNRQLPAAIDMARAFQSVDSIALDGIQRHAFPGCVILAARDGRLIYHKAFGNYAYPPDSIQPVTLESIYDLASVTKTSATTISIMKLYEQGKISLKKKIGEYLPWIRGSDKENIMLEDLLLHQAGLAPYIAFYRQTIDLATGFALDSIYHDKPDDMFPVRVAEGLYLRRDWKDTLLRRIRESDLGPRGRYVYSDLDFILLGQVVETVSGMPLDQYVEQEFYAKMGLATTEFNPRKRFPLARIVPTEKELHFRAQLLRGDVHDPGASLFGGVAGHAGLFSTAYDLSCLYQMLLNGGVWEGKRYLKKQTIDYFTAYHSRNSRRGFGFDKPEKEIKGRGDPYPSRLASQQTYGHTGFTGTCVWVDPVYKLVYVFLSNRVFPTSDNPRLLRMNIRGNIQDEFYRAIRDAEKVKPF